MAIPTVTFIGCGALGVMYASQMAKFLPKENLRFIADDDRIARYEKDGFMANGVRQSFQFLSPEKQVAPSDFMIFTVKSNQLQEAVHAARNYIGENTLILSFLNGISSEKEIAKAYGTEKVVYSMVAGMDATKEGNAVNFSKIGYIAVGIPGCDPEDQRIVQCKALLDLVQISCQTPENILKSMWWKYMLNVGINQCSALLKETYGLFQQDEHGEKMVRMVMEEACQVANAAGIGLTMADVDSCVATYKSLSADGKTSMCQDIVNRKPSEVDLFAGAIMALGEKHNVSTPLNRFIYHAVKAMESKF